MLKRNGTPEIYWFSAILPICYNFSALHHANSHPFPFLFYFPPIVFVLIRYWQDLTFYFQALRKNCFISRYSKGFRGMREFCFFPLEYLTSSPSLYEKANEAKDDHRGPKQLFTPTKTLYINLHSSSPSFFLVFTRNSNTKCIFHYILYILCIFFVQKGVLPQCVLVHYTSIP